MKAMTCWIGRLVTYIFQVNDKKKNSKAAKSRQVISSESLSDRMRKDIGLDYERNDAADYTKYL
ncbi:hypothetical protein AB4516_04800 [Vibrio sp. 10N.222.54.F12]|uniref:DUF3563 domain-containing protein n=1 Tax=Vibrio tasmaniensis 1F-267 TaxID=1191324 RepID=A0ABX3B5Q2_9VIBR|nr:hypothetical protein [Vibrio tasmaniensis]OEF44766.1 hypothetical protein A163_10860 [Vibrio tasmaniensis 1F-267]OEF68068.1 hypothetical protein A162_05610 [Vibrio tasmaniensis 1F-155]OEF73484.1 hypothetical protein A152_09905 [Vibrio tasmaniensis 1F-187]PML18121.1 hypothetical protein BCT83_06165 [Vibrio tasmaniensis]PMO88909.1 hypothetical protein BCT01_02060 [Vibrio tasmaniensis]